MRCLIIIGIFIFLTGSFAGADTVIMKDRDKIKGLVVEEYVDRIILNTADGERTIFRKDIDRIEYDTPEQNFMQLGRAYDAKGWYDKASFYYKKAMDVNPRYKEAREAYLASHAKMWRQEERMTRKELEHRSMVMEWWRNRNRRKQTVERNRVSLVKDKLGISLVEKDGIFTISEVVPDSSAEKAGIEEGDILVGIWGRLIRYSKMEDVIDELLGPKYSEVRVLIEKDISIPVQNIKKGDLYKELGIILAFEYEGLLIKEVKALGKGELAGLKKADLVVAIDKNTTRYLPLDSIISLINSAKGNGNLVFTVRRSLNLRREGR